MKLLILTKSLKQINFKMTMIANGENDERCKKC